MAIGNLPFTKTNQEKGEIKSKTGARNYAILGPITECGVVREDNSSFQKCKWCPNNDGTCKELAFDEFCRSLEAQKEVQGG